MRLIFIFFLTHSRLTNSARSSNKKVKEIFLLKKEQRTRESNERENET